MNKFITYILFLNWLINTTYYTNHFKLIIISQKKLSIINFEIKIKENNLREINHKNINYIIKDKVL